VITDTLVLFFNLFLSDLFRSRLGRPVRRSSLFLRTPAAPTGADRALHRAGLMNGARLPPFTPARRRAPRRPGPNRLAAVSQEWLSRRHPAR